MNAEEFEPMIRQLIGNRCWRITAGRITGSRMNLDFGDRMKTEVGKDRRIDECGVFGLQIGIAQWRVSDQEGRVHATSLDLLDRSAPAGIGIAQLKDRLVRSVIVNNRFFDLTIDFEGNWELAVFCNDSEEPADNYTFSEFEKYYSVECVDKQLVVNVSDCG